MKQRKYSEGQIVRIQQEAEAGVPVVELVRKYGFSQSAAYRWRAKYGRMEASALRKLKMLEEGNRRLKNMYAELSLERAALKDVLEGEEVKQEKKEDKEQVHKTDRTPPAGPLGNGKAWS